MTYDEAIRFWYSRINYEVRSAKPEDLRLGRMSNLLLFLEDPQDHVPTVHIAGTKGKGSTAAMIAAIAQNAGLKVGLFTSPHLVGVEERFRINGEPIAKADFAEQMSQLSPFIEAIEEHDSGRFTFFEIATALAWQYFRERKVDLAVMEVGLGGRFDSTNVCHPLVSVITSIGFDHMAQLGHTLEAIAFQKAGIIKSGVPCVSGVTEPGPRQVIRDVAKAEAAPLIECDFANLPQVNLLGEHQRRNAALAIAAVKQLPFNISDVVIAEALANIQWPARIEVMSRDPLVILDCAHNVPSVLALVKTLRAEFPAAKRKTCVFAVSSDKQYREMLPILAGYFDRFILTQYGNNPRCVPPETLASLLPDSIATIVTPAMGAFEYAKSNSAVSDLICITGSVFLAGELRPALLS